MYGNSHVVKDDYGTWTQRLPSKGRDWHGHEDVQEGGPQIIEGFDRRVLRFFASYPRKKP